MPRAPVMTPEEEAAIIFKAQEFWEQGNMEEYKRIRKTIPLQPYLAKFAKEHFGADFLINSGWNLAEAEAEFGHDWLTR